MKPVTAVVLALSLGGLLLAAGPAAAGKHLDTRPVRFFSVLRMDQVGEAQVAGGHKRGGLLKETVDIGPAAFILEPILAPARAIADILSTADGKDYHVLAQAPVKDPDDPHSAIGSVVHLDEYQTYKKRASDASLSITISRVVLQVVDDNGPLTDAECPERPCAPIIATAQFHARAYEGDFGQFFGIAGEANLQGSDEGWEPTVANFDAGVTDDGTPLWGNDFHVEGPITRVGPQMTMRLNAPRTIKVPLWPVKKGHLFVVHVTLQAEAADDRGGESAAQAFIEDPQHLDPPLIRTHGLQALGKPRIKEPALKPAPAARCAGAPSRKAGVIQLSRPTYSAGENHRRALVEVTRTGGSRGAASINVDATGGSAQPGSDFTSTSTRVRFGNGQDSPRSVEIPIRQDGTAEPAEKFTVSLAHVRCAKLGKQRSASVTILDDDQPPRPPPPTFTIGGTVDGLQGAGLVLSNLGDGVRVPANGSFTFPRTAVTGQPYEINIATQPTNPDQICTVEHGKGTVSIANVTDIAVHCTTPVIPSGLDSTFGDHGRVTTPGNGEGRALLIQPDGKIVTVGPREVGNNFHFQFGATRHDANGNLDPSFGTAGIATTSLGGNDDKARDAALMPDGGFVAVGQADPAGLANIDFGVVRYTPDGHPDPRFNTTGIETTDIAGRGDVANAVAVQPDGKIVVAGEAETAPGFFDFAVVRYNTDGTLDKSFDGDGIVTTDLGSQFDDATAIAIQPDGKIVLAGDTDQNVALVRYLANGKPDPTFNGTGTVVSNIGTNEANGVAITPGGTILIAGTRVGPKANRDPFVASYGPNGKLNLGFGDFGVAQADLSGGEDFGEDLTLDANGNIVVVGSASSATVSDMALVRFKPDGSVDTILTTDFHGTGDFGNALAIDSQGRIVAAGTSGDQFALMRANL